MNIFTTTWEKIKTFGRWTKKKAKQLLLWVGIIGIATASTIALLPEQIPEHLQLKAPKDKILFEQTVKDLKGNDIIKYLYISDREVPTEKDEIIEKRTKNAQIFSKGKNKKGEEEFVGNFYTGEPFYQDLEVNKWFQTETATTTPDVFKKQTKVSISEKIAGFFMNKALAVTTPYYVGAGDGEVTKDSSAGQPSQALWDEAHDAAVGSTAAPTAKTINLKINIYGGADLIRIQRGFFPIDTSGLPDDAVISAAILKIYANSVSDAYNGDGFDYLSVVKTFQASTSTLVTADFEDCGYDAGNEVGGRAKYLAVKGSADVDLTGVSTIAYTDFTLNATGIGWISTTSITMLGIREGHDIQDNFPGDPGEVNNYSGLNVDTSEQTGTAEDPYLSVTYTVPGTNMQVNIGDSWKVVAGVWINIGDAWKVVAGMQENIGDAWKVIY